MENCLIINLKELHPFNGNHPACDDYDEFTVYGCNQLFNRSFPDNLSLLLASLQITAPLTVSCYL